MSYIGYCNGKNEYICDTENLTVLIRNINNIYVIDTVDRSTLYSDIYTLMAVRPRTNYVLDKSELPDWAINFCTEKMFSVTLTRCYTTTLNSIAVSYYFSQTSNDLYFQINHSEKSYKYLFNGRTISPVSIIPISCNISSLSFEMVDPYIQDSIERTKDFITSKSFLYMRPGAFGSFRVPASEETSHFN